MGDDYQHQKGQEDGAHGRLLGTSGDAASPEYREGFEAGRFDYEKERFGEAYARAHKALDGGGGCLVSLFVLGGIMYALYVLIR